MISSMRNDIARPVNAASQNGPCRSGLDFLKYLVGPDYKEMGDTGLEPVTSSVSCWKCPSRKSPKSQANPNHFERFGEREL
jgi:hypothetical protein